MAGASKKRRDPVRLTRQSGYWSLEFTRLVAVDDHLMRPERRRVAASTDALRSLALSCPPERIREAETLMEQVDDGSERVFELADEGWTPSPTVRHSQRPLGRGEVTSLVTELQAQLLGMRALYDALLTRVIKLEASAHVRPEVVSELQKLRKVPSRRDMLLSLQNPGAAPLEPVDALGSTKAAMPTPAAAAPAPAPANPAPPTEPSAEGAAPPGPSRLLLPSSSDLIGCLQMLAADVPVKPEKGTLPSELGDFVLARLADETNEVIGAILLNRRASADLGGGLLSLPQAARDEQAQRGLDKDSQEALNEVMNNLGGLVNRTNPKCYTRLGALEPATLDAVPWLIEPAKKLALATPNGGWLWFLTH